MNELKKIQVGTPVVSGLALILTAIWTIAAVTVMRIGLGKEFAHLSFFWTLDFFFFPFVCAIVASLLAYGYFRSEKTRDAFTRVAMVVGFLPLFALGAIVLMTFFLLWGK